MQGGQHQMHDTYDDTLSFSPREALKYVPDKDNSKILAKLHRKELCEKIVHTIYSEVLFHKPKNIQQFIVEELLKPEGAISQLKS